MDIIVAGAGGFIGGHLTKSLILDGHSVRAIDIKPLEQWYQFSPFADNIVGDLSDTQQCMDLLQGY